MTISHIDGKEIPRAAWFQFYDYESGGEAKTPWEIIFIKATSEDAARDRFEALFGFSSYRECCKDCGVDYWVDPVDEPGEKGAASKAWLVVGDGPLSDAEVAEMDKFDSPYAEDWKGRAR